MVLGSVPQQVRRLKKGELLFSEGEKSRAMYLLKSGSIRLFLKKGNSNIEIDTIRPGQILGELAFLDGNPRSVSGEALVECELLEISGASFMEVVGSAPEWLKILLKTVVARLRAANSRVRQLESANVAIDYEKEGGKRSSQYQYLTLLELIKVCTALLVVGARQGKSTSDGLDVDLGWVSRYSHQVMGVPSAKLASCIDLLCQCDLAVGKEINESPRAYLKDLTVLEFVIEFLNEQNQLDPSKRTEISVKGHLIMSYIVKFLDRYSDLYKNAHLNLDLAPLKHEQSIILGKSPFRNEELSELLRLAFVKDLKIKSEAQAIVTLNPQEFKRAFLAMRMILAFKKLNEQKREVSK